MDVIRLVASDLDATLLDDQSQLPPDFAETVRALAEAGHPVRCRQRTGPSIP